ncbi:hypothetical protein P22_3841 [Propionispora sp. 2/2-37]|uniref:hypothetical protein n=1 Tax=Propionispora sp. 2/2-37 TaxID=1677858 RepID=UPI0006BB876A|nr:hypothetical protein [Propionispora sp. 2/2-37]CUH97706.1 hypothetical protein P22_3841 [Propionispora sp. 2/2-37]
MQKCKGKKVRPAAGGEKVRPHPAADNAVPAGQVLQDGKGAACQWQFDQPLRAHLREVVARCYRAWEEAPPDIEEEYYVQASKRFGELFRILLQLADDHGEKDLVYEFESCSITMNDVYTETAYSPVASCTNRRPSSDTKVSPPGIKELGTCLRKRPKPYSPGKGLLLNFS